MMTSVKPPAFEPSSGMRFGTTLLIVALVHVLVIVLLLSHFGWLGASNSEADSNTGQSGIVIPVTLEQSKEPELEAEVEREPEPESESEPEPEPKSEPFSSSKTDAAPQTDSVTAQRPEDPSEADKEIAIESDPATAVNPGVEPAKPAPQPPPKTAIPSAVSSSLTPPPSATASGANPAPSSEQLEVLPLSPAQVDPNYLHRPDPAYPALSKRLREEGTVVLRVSLDARGSVQDITIQTSSQFQRLDQAALEAVRQWRFIPATRGQQAVPSTVLVPIAFRHQ